MFVDLSTNTNSITTFGTFRSNNDDPGGNDDKVQSELELIDELFRGVELDSERYG